MFCTSCGAKNPDDAKFCFSCGKPLGEPVQAGGTPAPPPPVDNTQLYRDAARDFAAQKNTPAVGTVRAQVRTALRAGNKTAESIKENLVNKGFEPLHADLLITQERTHLETSNTTAKKSHRREEGGGTLIGGVFAMFLSYRIVSGLNQQGFQWNFSDWSQWLPAVIFLGGIIAIVRGIYLLATS